MFNLLRKVVVGVFLVIVAGTGLFFLSQPRYRRGIAQTAEEISEAVKPNKQPPIWSGTAVVIEVLAGDIVRVDTEGAKGTLVRLAGIDAPEMPDRFQRNGQPLAEESRTFLAEMIKGKAVDMAIVKTEPAKYPLVLLTLDRVLVNGKVVEEGFAESGTEGMDCIPAKLRHTIEKVEHRRRLDPGERNAEGNDR